MWGPKNKEPPLEIAVTDSRNFSPFALAVLRRQFDVAKAIMDIAQAQYKPEGAKRRKYDIETDDDDEDECVSSDDDDSSGDEDKIRVRGRDVPDDEFTIDIDETVTEMVESDVNPLDILSRSCDTYLFVDMKKYPNHTDATRLNGNLINLAIHNDDIPLLIFLLELGQALSNANVGDEGDSSRLYAVPSDNFKFAISLGHLQCLTELIRRTGAGLPLDGLAQDSGIEVKEKPKFYQGLSIHGKKRADWVAAARGDARDAGPEKLDPPLLIATHKNNLASVEWFLSTAPGRYYMEFAETHKEDKRLRALAQTEEGIEGSVMNWLNTNREYMNEDITARVLQFRN